MQIALRKRNFDAVFLQAGFDFPQVGGMNRSWLSDRLLVDPYDQFEIQAAVTEIDQPALRRLAAFKLVSEPVSEPDFGSGFQSRFLAPFLIAAIRDPEGHVHTPIGFAECPVGAPDC